MTTFREGYLVVPEGEKDVMPSGWTGLKVEVIGNAGDDYLCRPTTMRPDGFGYAEFYWPKDCVKWTR